MYATDVFGDNNATHMKIDLWWAGSIIVIINCAKTNTVTADNSVACIYCPFIGYTDDPDMTKIQLIKILHGYFQNKYHALWYSYICASHTSMSRTDKTRNRLQYF